MKTLKIMIITFCLAILLSGSLSVMALDPGEASIRAIVSNPQPKQGETISVTLFFENNSTESLTLTNAGLHFDWMPSDGFYGFNLNSTPINVQPGQSYVFQNPILIKVPENTSPGAHSYYAGVDGIQDASQTPFSLDSTTAEIQVVDNGGQTTAPTNPGSGNQGDDEPPDLLLYGAIAAVIIVVGLLIVVVLMRRKKSHTEKPRPPANQPTPSEPEQKPPGQDFSI